MVLASEEARNRQVVRAYYAAIADGMTDLEWDRRVKDYDLLRGKAPNRAGIICLA